MLKMLKRPIYIDLEGADLTGKTTLLKTTFREGDYSKILCFHDRGIMTHYVYNKCFRRFTEDLDMWFNEFIHFLEAGNGVVILTANENTIRKRFFDRNDDLFKLDRILAVNKEYVKLYFELKNTHDTALLIKSTVCLISTDDKTPEEVYKEASSFYGKLFLRGIE